MAKGLVITGVKAIDRKLKALEPKVAKKVLRPALRKAAKLIQANAVINAPVGETGRLARSIKVRAGKRTRKKQIQVDVRTAAEEFPGESFYGPAQEWGTSEVEGKGYMRRAYDARGDAAKRLIERETLIGIEREANSGG